MLTHVKWIATGCLLTSAIIVPFLLIGNWTENVVESGLSGLTSPFWISSLIIGLLVADLVLPIPSSFICLAAVTLLDPLSGAVVCWFGLSASFVFGYILGERLERVTLSRWFLKEDLHRAKQLMERVGYLTICISRPLPVLAEATAVAAGALGMAKQRTFVLALLANAGLATLYAMVGVWVHKAPSILIALGASMAVPGLMWLTSRLIISMSHAKEPR